MSTKLALRKSKCQSVPITQFPPHFIEVLGEEGLFAEEIAKSLEIKVSHVNQRLQGSFLSECEDVVDWQWAEIPALLKPGTTLQSEGSRYALNTRAAKAFVATYRNAKGRGYLNYLFGCQDVVEKHVPKLLLRIQELEAKELKRLNPPNKGAIAAPHLRPTKEDPYQVLWWHEPKDSLPLPTLLAARIRHAGAMMKGLYKKATANKQQLKSLGYNYENIHDLALGETSPE